MAMDLGDEAEEEQLLMDWISSRNALNKESKASLPALVEELNQLRVSVRNS